MRILLAGSFSPFTAREDQSWTHAIEKSLSSRGHQVDAFMLPVVQSPLLLLEQFMALRLLSIDPGCDLLITIGHPAFALKHPRKRSLLFSLASPLHEWFDSEFGVLATSQYTSIRRSVKIAEKRCLAEAESIVCGSDRLRITLKDEYGLKSVSHILEDVCEEDIDTDLPAHESWVVTESTLEPCDRIDLLLDAVAFSVRKWKLALFIPSASGVYYDALLQRIEKLGIKERVVVINAPLSKPAIAKSFSYVALHYQTVRIPAHVMRALKSNTTVIVLSDGGSLLEVVRHNVNGLMLKPDVSSIAQALDRASVDGSHAKGTSRGDLSLMKKIANVDKIARELAG